jgi:hypothetical protein
MAIGAWFATDFDEAQTTLDLPAVVTGGQEPGVCVVDQVVRGTGIVGRVTADFGAVAIRMKTDDRWVRVTVALSVDEVATRWWADRVKPPPGTPERPRLVTVRCQGEIRGAAVLARRQGRLRAGSGSAVVEFDLPAAAPDGDGLLIVELAEPGSLPDWAAGRFSTSSAVGLRVDRISIRPLTDSPLTRTPLPTSGCAFVVIGPDDPPQIRLSLAAVLPAPPVPRSPSNRWTRRKPARAAAKALRIARRVAGWAAAESSSTRRPGRPDVYGCDLVTGEPMPVEVVGRDAHAIDVRLPRQRASPVLVGVSAGTAQHRERTAHQLACTPEPVA